MAKVEAKLKKTKRRSAANPTKVRKAGGKPRTRSKKAPAEKSALDKVYEALDLSGPDDPNEDGVEKLRTSVNRVVAKRSHAIAKKLAQKTEEGNVTSAKLIVELVSKKQQSKKPSSKALLKYLSRLECEPEPVKPGTREAGQTTDRSA
jgi:hypothetical protein